MAQSLPRRLTAVLLLCLAAPSARADPVEWTYSWTADTPSVYATTGTGSVTFFAASGTGAGTSNIVAANLESVGAAAVETPDTFADAGYQLTLHLTDDASGLSGDLVFAGRFNGTLSAQGVGIENTFDSPTEQSLALGGNLYDVAIGPYAAPGLPGSFNQGAISAKVSVLDTVSLPTTPPIAPTPEPGSLALAASALVSLGMGRWWKGERRKKQAAI